MQNITLNTKNTTYQMGINEHGFLLHLYYGPTVQGDMSNSYLLFYFVSIVWNKIQKYLFTFWKNVIL